MPEKLCPLVKDNDGKPAKCGEWCAWFLPSKNPEYLRCSILEIGYYFKTVSYQMLRRRKSRFGPVISGATGEEGEDIPF